MREAAFNRAKANDYVFSWSQCFGRFARVLVSEGINSDVGMNAFDIGGDRVNELDQ